MHQETLSKIKFRTQISSNDLVAQISCYILNLYTVLDSHHLDYIAMFRCIKDKYFLKNIKS